jgi:hypothetical protein
MLNMLIAVMSNVQAKLEEKGPSQRFHAQLNFIIKNQHALGYHSSICCGLCGYIQFKKLCGCCSCCKSFWGSFFHENPYILAAYLKELEENTSGEDKS